MIPMPSRVERVRLPKRFPADEAARGHAQRLRSFPNAHEITPAARMMADAVVHVWKNGNAGDFSSTNIISTDASRAINPRARTKGPEFTGSKEDGGWNQSRAKSAV
jgi:hypothetical protein